jgi:sugar phosphate isomerase/epimerase
MQIGITSWSFEDTPSEEVFAWCSEHGLTGIQWDNVPADIEEMRHTLERFPEVHVHTLGRTLNYLYGTAEMRAGYAEQLRRDIEAAAQLGIGVVTIFAGRDPWKTVQENVSLFKDTFTPLVQLAEDRGVHLAMENCPQPDVWPAGGNMANTVENWRLLFEAVPSPCLGLTFDPSHFVWLGMDYIKAVHEFSARIFSVHAKDTEILDDVLADTGILGKGWWRYRLPGWGVVDWSAFFTALREVGYQGPVCIEHEDALWNHSLDEHKQGILMAARFLEQFDL